MMKQPPGHNANLGELTPVLVQQHVQLCRYVYEEHVCLPAGACISRPCVSC